MVFLSIWLSSVGATISFAATSEHIRPSVGVAEAKLPPPLPIKPSDMSGVWFGTDKQGYSIRIRLGKSGKGYLIIGLKGFLSEGYDIKLSKKVVYNSPYTVFRLVPFHNKRVSIIFSGMDPDFLLLTMKYKIPEENWRIEVPMLRETDVRSMMHLLKNADVQNSEGGWLPSKGLISHIESEIHLPGGRLLSSYRRYYTGRFSGNDHIVIGAFIESDRPGSEIVTLKNMPVRFDGGCSVINFEYDVEKTKIISLFCNGVA